MFKTLDVKQHPDEPSSQPSELNMNYRGSNSPSHLFVTSLGYISSVDICTDVQMPYINNIVFTRKCLHAIGFIVCGELSLNLFMLM